MGLLQQAGLGINNNPTGSLGLNISPTLDARAKQAEEDEAKRKRAEQSLKLQNFADTLRMVNANKSGNTQGVALYSNRLSNRRAAEQARLKAEQAKRDEEKLIASMPLEQQRIYKTFGANAAFQYGQQQRNAEIAGLQDIKETKSLRDAGFSDREINLFKTAGMKAKDIIELRDVEPDGFKSFEQLQKEVQSQYVPSEGLQLIDQAFGLKDTIDNAVNKAVGPIFGTPAKETNAAINSRGILNENLRERFVNQYSGRPSVYLNQRIDALLPMGTYTSEFDAMQKYAEIKRVLDQGKAELEENINSGMFEGTDLLTLQNEYKSTSFLLKDLETVIGNLRKDDSTSLDIVSEGKDSGQMTGQFGPFFGVTE